MSVDSYDLQRTYKVLTQRQSIVHPKQTRDLTDREAETIVRYLERAETVAERAHKAGTLTRYFGEQVLQNIVDHFDLDADVDGFVMGEYDGPWGDERIGYQMLPYSKHGLSLDDDRLVWIDDSRSAEFTSWMDAYEGWEEEKNNEDPWRKIEHEGPGNYGGEKDDTLWTPDFVNFYEYDDHWDAKKGERRQRGRLLFTVDVSKFGDDPDEADIAPDGTTWWEEYLLAEMRYRGTAHPHAFFWKGRYDDFHHWGNPEGAQEGDATRIASGKMRPPDSMERARVRYSAEVAKRAAALVPPGGEKAMQAKGLTYGVRPGDWLAAYTPRLGVTLYRVASQARRGGWDKYVYGVDDPPHRLEEIGFIPLRGRGSIWQRMAYALLRAGAEKSARVWFGNAIAPEREWVFVLFDLSAPESLGGGKPYSRRPRPTQAKRYVTKRDKCRGCGRPEVLASGLCKRCYHRAYWHLRKKKATT